ncbi:hypothetical protein FRC01_002267 [Tulasnella sp. 417]|nr:hypothetical protein FRC01_002267 [Tulasnella sp. 417]
MRVSLVVLFAASLASAASVFKRGDEYGNEHGEDYGDDYGNEHGDDGHENPPENVYEYPACANPCIAATDYWPCDHEDTACICLNSKFYEEIATCIDSACTPEETNAAAETFYKYCKDAGVDVQNPVPACGAHCYENTPTGDCPTDDDRCLCTYNPYIQGVDQCFKASCEGQDLETAEFVGKAWCRAAGVDISPVVDA